MMCSEVNEFISHRWLSKHYKVSLVHICNGALSPQCVWLCVALAGSVWASQFYYGAYSAGQCVAWGEIGRIILLFTPHLCRVCSLVTLGVCLCVYKKEDVYYCFCYVSTILLLLTYPGIYVCQTSRLACWHVPCTPCFITHNVCVHTHTHARARTTGGCRGVPWNPLLCAWELTRADGNYCAHARELLTARAMYKHCATHRQRNVASYNTDECIRDVRWPRSTWSIICASRFPFVLICASCFPFLIPPSFVPRISRSSSFVLRVSHFSFRPHSCLAFPVRPHLCFVFPISHSAPLNSRLPVPEEVRH